MEPDTMVAAVAQNTVWNTTYTHTGRLPNPMASILSMAFAAAGA